MPTNKSLIKVASTFVLVLALAMPFQVSGQEDAPKKEKETDSHC